MSAARRWLTGEVVIALVVLVAVLLTDLLWVRPQQRDLAAVIDGRRAAEAALWEAETGRSRAEAVLEHVSPSDSTDWKAAYTRGNPLLLLEDLRKDAGLRSLDVSLDGRKAVPPFERTTYFMSVYGSFERQMRFLKSLESARPLVTVDAFTMDTREADPRVTLKLNVSVLTLPETEATP